MECMKRFCVAEFGGYHLRQPTRTYYLQQLGINSARGFPDMFASLDCMHYEWKNCPVVWQGDYDIGKVNGPSYWRRWRMRVSTYGTFFLSSGF